VVLEELLLVLVFPELLLVVVPELEVLVFPELLVLVLPELLVLIDPELLAAPPVPVAPPLPVVPEAPPVPANSESPAEEHATMATAGARTASRARAGVMGGPFARAQGRIFCPSVFQKPKRTGEVKTLRLRNVGAARRGTIVRLGHARSDTLPNKP
jgi:hypothetical protein